MEDPVEYQLKGVNQIQVNEKSGLTFARGLRSILRHDPDVILIGEIRDAETAQIAVQASLTGHLVFSTLHTNDAPGALTRLVDMGVEPYLVASSLEAVLAQRLVRVLCIHCKQPDNSPTAHEFKRNSEFRRRRSIYKSVGCRECRNTGFFGRHAIFEWMDTDEEIRQLILKNASTDQIRAAARTGGMRTLAEDGWRLVAHRHHNSRGSFERDDGKRSRAHDQKSDRRTSAASIAVARKNNFKCPHFHTKHCRPTARWPKGMLDAPGRPDALRQIETLGLRPMNFAEKVRRRQKMARLAGHAPEIFHSSSSRKKFPRRNWKISRGCFRACSRPAFR